ncbi:uncharacterized protein A4U43_C07F18870 [Asparagus officinalis]|uniref:Uncharacterized protein n=1 Tax=Asparagus officinalis TaxID=4686 RepID=A0A5P1ED60_ASPOF|nr:uncharacterized protein A4U43_C07F18870 [Asparagus officinalis]
MRRLSEEAAAGRGCWGRFDGGGGCGEKKRREGKGEDPEALETVGEVGKPDITLRPLNMEDMRQAKNQVAASFAEGSIMSELKQWNSLYGEGGSRKKEQLSYFL